jgi:hypothetical protein
LQTRSGFHRASGSARPPGVSRASALRRRLVDQATHPWTFGVGSQLTDGTGNTRSIDLRRSRADILHRQCSPPFPRELAGLFLGGPISWHEQRANRLGSSSIRRTSFETHEKRSTSPATQLPTVTSSQRSWLIYWSGWAYSPASWGRSASTDVILIFTLIECSIVIS